MKTEKTINLTAYTVEYIDPREEKPRTVRTETVILDGGKISALHRLDMNPGGYITRMFEHRTGCTVAAVRKGDSLKARLDLAELWQQTAAQIELDRVKAQLFEVMQQLHQEEGAAGVDRNV